MSIVADQVRRIDAQIDRILLNPLVDSEDKFAVDELDDAETEGGTRSTVTADLLSPRINDLLRIVKKLSSTSTAVLPAAHIRDLLHDSRLATADEQHALEAKGQYESEVEWLLVSKATTQIYGLILNTLLDDIIPLSHDIWYWDQILGSYTYSSLYAVQTSPVRWLIWAKDIYHESSVRSTFSRRTSLFSRTPQLRTDSLSQRWSRFYGIVRETVMERSLKDVQHKMFSTVSLCRSDARRKQSQLKKLREMTASGLGVLIDEGLSFGMDEYKSESHDHGMEWKGVVERSVALMDMVLRDVATLDRGVSEFEDKVFAGVEQDPDLSIHAEDMVSKPAVMARRLLFLLEKRIPTHTATMRQVVQANGQPSRLIRYWLPAGLVLISSSTILRILVNRKADIVNWIRDFGVTARDFWFNWVVEPVRKVIGTIRHDSQSEIAIMSRDSLKADRESLERMVVDFAVDKPSLAGASAPLTETQIADIRSKVKEGDVTPVLKAFEQDLRQPFVGAVRGDLVRSLLIQVQKTKVDLEIAISGIDALLKSQELVFGFVGLTPGLFVSVAVLSYLRGMLLSNRRGIRRQGERVGRCVRTLRNIDRIFTEATPSQNNLLSYKDHGLLVTEVHILRNLVRDGRLMPREIESEFLEDLDDLANVKGIQIQQRALERIRWAYARWLQAH
ncbi:ATP synthase regulation protein NCA2-domain-containing protein [Coniella lustricola]|uniref:ATP synthase regulation protein NCA2-domain-containing protein n=1 Tax=Coniella lustricola TaxID=2025994 RepID=A0A2T3AJ79_9PEZI|nr:ATP synthase regulation protein NCA2-domain-containing protein [Coniella lustricola]